MQKKAPQEIDLGPINRVLALAEKHGFYDAELARRFGADVGSQHLNNWKTRGLPPSRYAAAARIFGVSIDFIANGNATIDRAPTIDQSVPMPDVGLHSNEDVMTESEREMFLTLMQQLSAAQRLRVVKTIQQVQREGDGGALKNVG